MLGGGRSVSVLLCKHLGGNNFVQYLTVLFSCFRFFPMLYHGIQEIGRCLEL